jgi:hypothetical protein
VHGNARKTSTPGQDILICLGGRGGLLGMIALAGQQLGLYGLPSGSFLSQDSLCTSSVRLLSLQSLCTVQMYDPPGDKL